MSSDYHFSGGCWVSNAQDVLSSDTGTHIPCISTQKVLSLIHPSWWSLRTINRLLTSLGGNLPYIQQHLSFARLASSTTEGLGVPAQQGSSSHTHSHNPFYKYSANYSSPGWGFTNGWGFNKCLRALSPLYIKGEWSSPGRVKPGTLNLSFTFTSSG